MGRQSLGGDSQCHLLPFHWGAACMHPSAHPSSPCPALPQQSRSPACASAWQGGAAPPFLLCPAPGSLQPGHDHWQGWAGLHSGCLGPDLPSLQGPTASPQPPLQEPKRGGSPPRCTPPAAAAEQRDAREQFLPPKCWQGVLRSGLGQTCTGPEGQPGPVSLEPAQAGCDSAGPRLPHVPILGSSSRNSDRLSCEMSL